jgi:hypothetical protein
MLDKVRWGVKTNDPINTVYFDGPEGCHLRQQVSRVIRKWQIDGLDLVAMFSEFLIEPFNNESSTSVDKRQIGRKQRDAHGQTTDFR